MSFFEISTFSLKGGDKKAGRVNKRHDIGLSICNNLVLNMILIQSFFN